MDVIKLRIDWRNHGGLSKWAINIITSIFKREMEGHVTTETKAVR